MQYIEIEPTYKSPKVVFNPEDGIMEISGRSVLINVEEFYRPLLKWMDEFIEQHKSARIEFTFDLEYFNLSSSKRFLFFLYKLQEMNNNGGEVKVNWHYPNNDLDILETGQDFSTMVRIPFNFIGYEKLKARQRDSSHSLKL